MSGLLSTGLAAITGPPREVIIELLHAAARAQGLGPYHQLEYALSTASDDCVCRSLTKLDDVLTALVHRELPEEDWVVLRPSRAITALNAAVFRRGRPGRGLHLDASSPSGFVSSYCTRAVKERLSPQCDAALLDAHVQPVNLWMLLEGDRALLLLPERPAPQTAYSAGELEAAHESLCAALAAGADSLVLGASLYPHRLEPSHGQPAEARGLPVLLFDSCRLYHCGLCPLPSASPRADAGDGGRDCSGSRRGGGGSSSASSSRSADTRSCERSHPECWSVDFRTIAIRRAATSWAGGPLDLVGLEELLSSSTTRIPGCRWEGVKTLATAPAPTTSPRESSLGAVVGAEATSAAVVLDYGKLTYRTYQAVLGGVTLHFWATSDTEDVCLPGCEVEACVVPPPEPLDAALYAYDDTPGEKLRTGMVFGPVIALCAALDALLTAPELPPPELTELTELTAPELPPPELTELTELTAPELPPPELTELTELTAPERSPPELTELTELTAPERSPQPGELADMARPGELADTARPGELADTAHPGELADTACRGGGGGLRLLELGAGVGLVGLWAAARGAQDGAQLIAQVVLTDRGFASLELMRRNAAFFAVCATTTAPTTIAPTVQVRALDWAEAHPAWLDGSFDLVAASDALYVPAVVPLFFATAAAALREGGRLVLAMQGRSGVLLDREVLPAAKAVGLALETSKVDLRQGAGARDDARPGGEAQATVILTFVLVR